MCYCLVVGSILVRGFFTHFFFISLLGPVRGFRRFRLSGLGLRIFFSLRGSAFSVRLGGLGWIRLG